MFRALFLFATLFSVYASDSSLRGTMSTLLDDHDEWKQFSNFQERFNRKYETLEELENRFQVFRTNLRNIVIHNLDHNQKFHHGN